MCQVPSKPRAYEKRGGRGAWFACDQGDCLFDSDGGCFAGSSRRCGNGQKDYEAREGAFEPASGVGSDAVLAEGRECAPLGGSPIQLLPRRSGRG